jgi:hypothetical protein
MKYLGRRLLRILNPQQTEKLLQIHPNNKKLQNIKQAFDMLENPGKDIVSTRSKKIISTKIYKEPKIH